MKKPTKRDYYQAPQWSASAVKAMLSCEAAAAAGFEQPSSTALLVGSFVDAALDGKRSYDEFVTKHPEIFNSRTGELKADFRQAEAMVERAKNDPVFMQYCKGERQKIFVGEIGGLPFKAKLDFYQKGKRIVDLKTTRDFAPVWTEDRGKVSFADAYYYPLQMAIYQELARQNTGDTLPCYLACITKQDPPDIALIESPQERMDLEMDSLKDILPRLNAIRSGAIEPHRCGHCRYCRQTKKITKPIRLEELNYV